MKRILVLLVSVILIACSGDEQGPDVAPEVLVESLICYEEHPESWQSQIVTIKPDGTGKELLLKETSPLFHHRNTDPKWSFDRKKIVFSSWADAPNPTDDIYIVDRDGSNLKNLTNSSKPRQTPSLSPDETTLIFSTDDDLGNSQIFSKVLSQPGEKQLTYFTSDSKKIFCYFPTWSYDGKKIVFTSNKDGSTSNVYYMNADGTDVKKVTNNTTRAAFGPRLSPNGSTILYYTYKDDLSGGNVFTINIDGFGKKQLTNVSANEEYTSFCIDPSWSADGSQILFVSHHSDPEFDELFVMQADGTDAHKIMSSSTIKWFPDWK